MQKSNCLEWNIFGNFHVRVLKITWKFWYLSAVYVSTELRNIVLYGGVCSPMVTVLGPRWSESSTLISITIWTTTYRGVTCRPIWTAWLSAIRQAMTRAPLLKRRYSVILSQGFPACLGHHWWGSSKCPEISSDQDFIWPLQGSGCH